MVKQTYIDPRTQQFHSYVFILKKKIYVHKTFGLNKNVQNGQILGTTQISVNGGMNNSARFV